LRILITGATGFVGRHLVRHLTLAAPDGELHGTSLRMQDDIYGVTLHEVDLRDPVAVYELIATLKPEQIYHLAAQADVRASFDIPWETFESNVRGQLNIFEACVKLNLAPRMIIASTGELYANATLPDRPTDETVLPQPTSPYAVSKLTQEMLCIQYHFSRELPAIIVRLFNQIGPGQRQGFVAPDFAIQIARIEAGEQAPVMKVGNLEARRDFTDVRDVSRAMRLLMASGQPGEIYNVASGTTHTISDILTILCQESKVEITVEADPARMRPARVPLLWGDNTRLHNMTSWRPLISLQSSLRDVLNDCRQRVLMN
jgi:GDP-4-dehydro-6-deoxy-D-mannose reductase